MVGAFGLAGVIGGIVLLGALLGSGLARADGASEGSTVNAPGPAGMLEGVFVDAGPGAPIVLIVPGSGPTDRDGNSPLGVAAAPYRLLAEGLSARGIGSIRIDKRGLFGSAPAWPDPNDVTIDAYADDIGAWVSVALEKTGAGCVWLLGHSEGGLVAMASAARGGSLCGVILVATPGRSFGDILRGQLGANPANADLMDDAMSAIAALERGERVDVGAFHPALQGLFAPSVQGFISDVMRYRPTDLIARLAPPILILRGDRDIQVGEEDASLLLRANPAADRVVLPGVNHVLKTVPGPDRRSNLDTYGDPNLALAEGVVKAIADFIRRHAD